MMLIVVIMICGDDNDDFWLLLRLVLMTIIRITQIVFVCFQFDHQISVLLMTESYLTQKTRVTIGRTFLPAKKMAHRRSEPNLHLLCQKLQVKIKWKRRAMIKKLRMMWRRSQNWRRKKMVLRYHWHQKLKQNLLQGLLLYCQFIFVKGIIQKVRNGKIANLTPNPRLVTLELIPPPSYVTFWHETPTNAYFFLWTWYSWVQYINK